MQHGPECAQCCVGIVQCRVKADKISQYPHKYKPVVFQAKVKKIRTSLMTQICALSNLIRLYPQCVAASACSCNNNVMTVIGYS